MTSQRITPRRLTVEDLVALGEAGRIAPDERVELLDGEIFTVTPASPRHAAAVKRLAKLLEASYGDRAIVSVQDPLRLSDTTLLEPDLALLRLRADFYADAHPGPGDTLLVVEVALSSLAFDRDRKLPLYALAGVPEVWLVDLDGGRVEVHELPGDGGYGRVEAVAPGSARVPRALSGPGVIPLPS